MQQQAGLRPIINTNRAVTLEGYGRAPMHAKVFECIGTGEASPRVARYLCSVELGGFGVVLYASAMVQGAQEMQALHTALETTEEIAQRLEVTFANLFARVEKVPKKLHASSGLLEVVFDLMSYGEPMERPTMAAGQQVTTEIHG